MKSNAPKRKVFDDAVDMLMDDMPVADGGITEVQVSKIKPFHAHPFRLYEGERLEDMVESIREHGVLNPVIVLKQGSGFEMLAGHNRWNAAKMTGLKKIPAIVKEGLSDEDAYVYVIETNLMQRSFSDLKPTEKAAVLKARYEKVASQGKRNDIIREIARLEGKELPDATFGHADQKFCDDVGRATCGHADQKLTTRDSVGKEYELSGSSVGRLIKLNDLIDPWKDALDRGAMFMRAALQMAFMPAEELQMIYDIAVEMRVKLSEDMMIKLRSHSGTLTEKLIRRYLKAKPQRKHYTVPAKIVDKYFRGMDPDQVDAIVEQALDAWFGKGETDVQH